MVDTRGAEEQAIGAYWGRWYDHVLPLFFGATLLLAGAARRDPDWWSVSVGLVLVAIGSSPATVVGRSGVVLLYRFRRLPWSSVAAIQEIDHPRSRECLRLRMASGPIFVLRGVPGHRLAGLMRLAERSRSAGDD